MTGVAGGEAARRPNKTDPRHDDFFDGVVQRYEADFFSISLAIHRQEGIIPTLLGNTYIPILAAIAQVHVLDGGVPDSLGILFEHTSDQFVALDTNDRARTGTANDSSRIANIGSW